MGLSKLVLLVVVSLGVIPSAFAQNVSRAKAAELALHRIERLVITKKIENGFRFKVRTLTLAVLEHQSDEQPAFKATLQQYAPANGSQKSIEVVMNGAAKPLAPVPPVGDGEAVGAPVWPGADSITLAEDSLHCVQGELINNSPLCASNAQLALFSTGFSHLDLSQEGSGADVVAVAEIHAVGTKSVLKIRLKADGSLASERAIEVTAGEQIE